MPLLLLGVLPMQVPTWEGGGAQYGQGAVSALGSGRACPATVIAFCPSCQLVARPLSVRRTGVHPSTLPPLATLAVRALLGLGGGGIKAEGVRRLVLPILVLGLQRSGVDPPLYRGGGGIAVREGPIQLRKIAEKLRCCNQTKLNPPKPHGAPILHRSLRMLKQIESSTAGIKITMTSGPQYCHETEA